MATSLANTQSRAELSASRARIVAAPDETRRRLERDLHDGIQQRLVWLGLKAQMIQKMTPQPADNIQSELLLLADGLFTALDELREISHGIHPAVLCEAGLGPALCGAGRARPESRLAAGPAGRGGRLLHRVRGARQHRQARAGNGQG